MLPMRKLTKSYSELSTASPVTNGETEAKTEKAKSLDKTETRLRAGLTLKPGSSLLPSLPSGRTMELWDPEEPTAWERSWGRGSDLAVQSPRDRRPGFWF